MLLPNSLERLLRGMAETLENTIMPHVHEEFALMQCKALLELIRNVDARVEWRCANLTEENRQIEVVLEALVGTGWVDAQATPDDVSERAITPAERQHELLERFGRGRHWLERARAELDQGSLLALEVVLKDFLLFTFEDEAALLRTGMYRSKE